MSQEHVLHFTFTLSDDTWMAAEFFCTVSIKEAHNNIVFDIRDIMLEGYTYDDAQTKTVVFDLPVFIDKEKLRNYLTYLPGFRQRVRKEWQNFKELPEQQASNDKWLFS